MFAWLDELGDFLRQVKWLIWTVRLASFTFFAGLYLVSLSVALQGATIALGGGCLLGGVGLEAMQAYGEWLLRLHPKSDGTMLKGPPKLSLVAILVRNMKGEHVAPLHGFMHTIDVVGHFLTGGAHDSRRMRSWLTHFAMVLVFEGDPGKWILERDNDDTGPGSGVRFYKCDELSNFDCWKWHVRIPEYAPEGIRHAIVCNVAYCMNDWPFRTITRHDVENFVMEQKQYHYSLLSKNCKHMVYDFYKYKLQHTGIHTMEFPHFCEMLEKIYVENGGEY